MKGLYLNIMRTAGYPDCTNGGLSSKNNKIWVKCPRGNVDVAEADENDVPVFDICLGRNNHLSLVPTNSGKMYMAGGNLANTSDSRWSEYIESLCGYRHSAISIHDRTEG